MIRSPLDNRLRAQQVRRSWRVVAEAINVMLAAHEQPQRVTHRDMVVTRRDGWTIIALREVSE